MLVTLLLLGLLVICSGYFSLTETAFFSLSSTKVKTYAKSQNPRRRLIARLLSQPRNFLVTVFTFNTLVNVLVQNVTSSLFGPEGSWVLKVGVPFIVLLVLGEIFPKYLGMQLNESLAYYTAPSINFFHQLIQPLTKVFVNLTAPVSRIMFFFLQKEESISKEELQHVLKRSEETGVLPKDESELISGYLNLKDATVKELMHPREDVLLYDEKDPFSKLNYLFVDQQCTRIPVYQTHFENILGIISAKTYFLHLPDLLAKKVSLIDLLEKPLYIPENTLAKFLLKKFEETQQEIALVVDEYGSFSGLVAYENLFEVVVGQISDLRDQKTLYTHYGRNEIVASGKMELSTLNSLFQTLLQSRLNMLTIGGWLTEQLGDIPKSGTKFESDGLLFQVLSAAPNRVRRVYIRKISSTKQKKPKK